MSECWTKSAEKERAHFGLAVACARRFAGRGTPMEELIGEAEAALLWAASRFDQSRGVCFSTYAVPFALGALRELCRKSAPMHIPRDELRLLCAAESARDGLRRSLGREPTVTELGRRLNVQPHQLAAMLAAKSRMSSPVADPAQLALIPDGGDGVENRVLVKDAIRSLGKPYAQVLWLRYFVGCSQMEIARRYHISQSKVSRWEREGKERLRKAL